MVRMNGPLQRLKQQAKERGLLLSRALRGGWVLRPVSLGHGKPDDNAIYCKTIDEIREYLDART